MNIGKYGKIRNYGFGVNRKPNRYSSASLYFLISVIADSEKVTSVVETIDGFHWNHPGLRDESGSLPIYVLFDEDTQMWYEYFTGIPISLRRPVDVVESPCPAYDVDSGCFYKKKEWTIDRVCAREITAESDVIEMNAGQFENEISHHSEQEIQEHVKKLYYMKETADKWWDAFQEAISRVKMKRDKNEKELEETKDRLLQGFGKYSAE